jgi:hypothetical protein
MRYRVSYRHTQAKQTVDYVSDVDGDLAYLCARQAERFRVFTMNDALVMAKLVPWNLIAADDIAGVLEQFNQVSKEANNLISNVGRFSEAVIKRASSRSLCADVPRPYFESSLFIFEVSVERW